jgi:hypothetical protein
MGVERLENGIKKITLRGRMDIEGTNVVDLPLSTETSTEKASKGARSIARSWNAFAPSAPASAGRCLGHDAKPA